MKVLITGATGFIGRKLAAKLFQNKHQLVVLSRNVDQAKRLLNIPCDVYPWDSHSAVPEQAWQGVDAVIHLAGESIASGRWTDSKKDKIKKSRVESTKILMDAIEQKSVSRPSIFISSSAIGFYGDRGSEILTENSPPGSGFLSEVCQEWEAQAIHRKISGMRTVAIRTGIVLEKEGGALGRLLPIFKLGLGGPIGSGKQWMSWIHLDDLIAIYCFALENSAIEGPLNAVSPQSVTNAEFSKNLAQVLRRPAVLFVPSILLKTALGEMATLVLASQRVSANHALQQGFSFAYPELKSALQEIVS